MTNGETMGKSAPQVYVIKYRALANAAESAELYRKSASRRKNVIMNDMLNYTCFLDFCKIFFENL